jgi:hypothetical protein
VTDTGWNSHRVSAMIVSYLLYGVWRLDGHCDVAELWRVTRGLWRCWHWSSDISW